MVKMWIPEDWDASLKCACQSIRQSLQDGMALSDIAAWFYSDDTDPYSYKWADHVLVSRWDTRTWSGVFEAWDECGRPWYDRCECDFCERGPDKRREAQAYARLEEIGELVYRRFPEALEWSARELGWEVCDVADFPDGMLPVGSITLDPEGLKITAESPRVTVLVPPSGVSSS